MNIYELLFLVSLFGMIGLILIKVFNVMRKFMSGRELYDIKGSFILFILYFFLYIIGFVVMMLNPEILIYNFLFRLCTWLITLNVLFFFVELIYHLYEISQTTVRKRYFPERT